MDKLEIYRKYSPTLYNISPKLRNKILDTSLYKEKDNVDYNRPKIRNIEMRITEKCNLRCPMCWWWGINGVGFLDTKYHSERIYNELSNDEIKSVIDQVEGYSPSLTFIGGEIFVRKDALDLIKYASNKLKMVSLVTNGTLLTSEMCEELSHLKNLEITFSLDGTESVHDSIRGKGNYDRTINSIRNILKCRDEPKKPLVTTNSTVTPEGSYDLPNLVKEVESIGVDVIKIQHLWFTSKEVAEKHISEVKKRLDIVDRGVESYIIDVPSIVDIQKIVEALDDIERSKHKVPVLIKPRLTKKEIFQYYSDLTFRKRNHCNVAFDSFVVESDGNVVFCPDEWISGFKLGNIRTSTIEEIWNGKRANNFRKTLKNDGLFPGCSRCCSLNL